MTMENDLVERLREDAEMLQDGLQKNLTDAWHNVVMKQAAKNSIEAASRIQALEAELAQTHLAYQAENKGCLLRANAAVIRADRVEAELARKTEALRPFAEGSVDVSGTAVILPSVEAMSKAIRDARSALEENTALKDNANGQ